MNQTQAALIIAATAIAIGLTGVLARIRIGRLHIATPLLAIIMIATGVGFGVMVLAAAVDNQAWWLLPAGLWLLVFLAAFTVRPGARTDAIIADMEHQFDQPDPVPEDNTPAAVNYDQFVIMARTDGLALIHYGPNPRPCLIEFWMRVTGASVSTGRLVELVNQHQCQPAFTEVMPAVAP